MLQNREGKIIVTVNSSYNTDIILLTEEQKRLLDYLMDNEINIFDDITIIDKNSNLKEI